MEPAIHETERVLLERIMRAAGLETTSEAATALQATLAALGEELGDEARHRFAMILPARSIAGSASAKARAADVAVEEFFDRVAKHEHVRLGFAREHAAVVCRVIGETLGEAERRALANVLPASLVALFEPPPEPGAAPPHHAARPARHDTLATGRPGSRQPIAESPPPGPQSHSVAREANPHGDTKLSSAAGTTQERLDESLATTHPDTRRALGEAGD